MVENLYRCVNMLLRRCYFSCCCVFSVARIRIKLKSWNIFGKSDKNVLFLPFTGTRYAYKGSQRACSYFQDLKTIKQWNGKKDKQFLLFFLSFFHKNSFFSEINFVILSFLALEQFYKSCNIYSIALELEIINVLLGFYS